VAEALKRRGGNSLGARSAIFAPVKNVGAIIIDEEHDTSYISESNPRYFTEDIAKFRAGYNNAKLILGSATPQPHYIQQGAERPIPPHFSPREGKEQRNARHGDYRHAGRGEGGKHRNIPRERCLSGLEKTINAGNQAIAV
jgi:primosomal protein N'